MRRLALSLMVAFLLIPSFAAMAEEPVETSHASTAHLTAATGHAEADAPREHEVIEFDAATAIWVLIIFVVLLAVLYPTAWKNVLAGLKACEAKIRGDISSAEAARHKAEATLKEYSIKLAEAETKVRDMIAKAVNDAEAAAATVRTRTQAEAEEAKEKALKEIETAKTTAVREVYDQAAVLATSVAEKILRRNLNADDQRDLVARSLEQMQSVNKN